MHFGHVDLRGRRWLIAVAHGEPVQGRGVRVRLADAKTNLVDGDAGYFATLCGNGCFMSRVTKPGFLADVKALKLRYGIEAVMKLTCYTQGWFGLISRDRECLRALFDVMNDTEGRKQARAREACRKRKRAV